MRKVGNFTPFQNTILEVELVCEHATCINELCTFLSTCSVHDENFFVWALDTPSLEE